MRTLKKPRNKWGVEFERLLNERHLSYDKVIAILHSYGMFSSLHRTTLYRWGTCAEEKISPMALTVLETIRSAPKVNVATEVVLGWIEKMKEIDEQLRVTRSNIHDLIAQLTFHQSS